MSVTYIPFELRRLVRERAIGLCEYCLIAAEDTYFGCEFDHVISEKHGGRTEAINLAVACVPCNQAKGSDIGSLDSETRSFVRFYNPRIDLWGDHFSLNDYRIVGISAIGRVTASIFNFNQIERLFERQALYLRGRFPSEAALTRIRARSLGSLPEIGSDS